MPRIRKSGVINTAAAETVWRIAAYIRLSREDGGDESQSVVNQKKIITEYLEKSFDGRYTVTDYYIDDGLTGTDDSRASFMRMIQDIEKGAVNCMICKTLSRAFRNYSDQGYYLEYYFQQRNIRFICMGDPKIDTYLNPESVYGMDVPITGLMNDRYAAQTSNAIRRTFATKRRNGEFIGAFAPYGYDKDPDDKSRFIIDEEAAAVVRDIFKWFVYEGMSKQGITKRLNELGIPNPCRYKRQKGLAYSSPTAKSNDGMWSSGTVDYILRNRMYAGDMVQGRYRVVSYKVHDCKKTPESEWFIKEDTHEPVVDRATLDKARALMLRDTRTAPQEQKLYLFSGFMRCGDCGKAMTRRKAKNLVYYACRTYKEKSKTNCTRHSIREDALNAAVLSAIQQQIRFVGDISALLDEINKASVALTQPERLAHMLKLRQEDLTKAQNVLDGAYVDWRGGAISQDQYYRVKDKLTAQTAQLEQAIQNLREEIGSLATVIKSKEPCLAEFLKHGNIRQLDRAVLVELVKTIYVYEGGGIRIEFAYADKFKRVIESIENNSDELVGVKGEII